MVRKAKIFMNGRSQAVRLPKEFRFDCDEVFVEKRGDQVILSPRAPGWDELFDQPPAFDEDFLRDRGDAPPQERNFD